MNKINLRKETNTKGITLLALVITIIILVILASVSIQMSTGQKGLLIKAEVAVQSNKKSQREEKIKIAVFSAQMAGNGTLTTENLNNEFRAAFNDDSIEIEKIEDKWYFEEYSIDEKGKVEIFYDIFAKEYKKVEYIESKGK